MRRILLFVLAGITIMASLAVSSPTLASTLLGDKPSSTSDQVVAATLNPVADSFVRKDYPTTNYGSYPELRGQSSPLLIGYLKFSVQGISAPITKATLRMYSLAAVSSGYKVYRVTDNSWSESTINYNNSSYLGSYVNASGAVSANAWTAVDVTSYVKGNGTYSFGFTDPSSTMIRLGSRESSNKPQLVIQTGTSSLPTPTPTIKPANSPTPTIKPVNTPTPTAKPTSTPPPPSNLLWSANMETGDLTQWNNGGGEFDSGTYASAASRDYAHTGAYSGKLTITTPPESAVRLFRWAESQTHTSLYYSNWYYFPRAYSVANYWNIMQWKSKTSTANDPFFTLNVGGNGSTMQLYLYDWQRRVSYGQSTKTLPVGQWVHVEGFYQCAADSTGKVTIWQDGVQIINVSGLSTRYSNGDCQWSVNNYSDSLSPSPATIYIDDAAIGTSFIP